MSKKTVKFYTVEENALIMKSSASEDKATALRLGRTPGAIAMQRGKLNRQASAPVTGEDFTAKEVKRILSTTKADDRELAEEFGTTVTSVKQMREHLNFEKAGIHQVKAAAKIPDGDYQVFGDAMNGCIGLDYMGTLMSIDPRTVGAIVISDHGINILNKK